MIIPIGLIDDFFYFIYSIVLVSLDIALIVKNFWILLFILNVGRRPPIYRWDEWRPRKAVIRKPRLLKSGNDQHINAKHD
jgi:hypothetical protein